jgi:hypothetical protein
MANSDKKCRERRNHMSGKLLTNSRFLDKTNSVIGLQNLLKVYPKTLESHSYQDIMKTKIAEFVGETNETTFSNEV